MLWISCQKGDSHDETIILLGEESYVKTFKSMIPDTLYSKFVSQMGNIYEGYIPPNIEGEYFVDPKECIHSNFNTVDHSHDMIFRITDQHNRVARIQLYDGGSVITDTVFVMGNNQFFTVYFTENKIMPHVNGTYSHIIRNVFITGEKTDYGIRNLMYGNILTSVPTISDPFVINFEPGNYFIYTDTDGFSENCDWFEKHGY